MAGRDRTTTRRVARWAGWFLGLGLLTAVTTAPLTVQRTVESLRFSDLLGTVPVEVTLVHNGYSVLDTGVLGSVFWDRTGPLGLGADLRVTGPPNAGGTLASYVDPSFLKVNAQSLTDPAAVGRAYSRQLSDRFTEGFLERSLLLGLGGGAVWGLILLPRMRGHDRRRKVLVVTATGVGMLLISSGVAAYQYAAWPGSDPAPRLYPLAARPQLAFTSPQAREVAEQVQPFIEKNVTRLKQAGTDYEDTAAASITEVLPRVAGRLTPREGERIVLAEADPQGSLVGTHVRKGLYAELQRLLGADTFVARTISGDVSSNGTVAEEGYVRGEAEASPGIPVVAVKGDHDSEVTVKQLERDDVDVVDRKLVEAGGLTFTGGADPDFKSLFGGIVTNPSGVSPMERGAQTRALVDEEADGKPVQVILHQPDAMLGYLGIEDIDLLRATRGHEDAPWDDGIPDLPPGSVTYGHWHDPDGPFVVWNTDTPNVTWTVVDQLGTSGGVEEQPTINRFSTPYSPPLKPLSLRLHYVDEKTGLVTGTVELTFDVQGRLTVGQRQDLGQPQR
jgi:hypothetical protein